MSQEYLQDKLAIAQDELDALETKYRHLRGAVLNLQRITTDEAIYHYPDRTSVCRYCQRYVEKHDPHCIVALILEIHAA